MAWQYFGFSVRSGSWFEQWFKHSKNLTQNRRKAHNKYGTINEYSAAEATTNKTTDRFAAKLEYGHMFQWTCSWGLRPIPNVIWKHLKIEALNIFWPTSISFAFMMIWFVQKNAVISCSESNAHSTSPSAVRKWISTRFGCGWTFENLTIEKGNDLRSAHQKVKKANGIYYFIVESWLFAFSCNISPVEVNGSFFPVLLRKSGLSNNNICFSSLSALNIYYFFFACSSSMGFSWRSSSLFVLLFIAGNDDCVLCVFLVLLFFMPSATKTFHICAVMCVRENCDPVE